MTDLILRDEVFRIQGAVFDVAKTMGHGFLEAVYQECLALEFTARSIPFRAAPRVRLHYKDCLLQQAYIPDFICFDAIVLELKALAALASDHDAQVLNYLKASRLKVGLLVNFGAGPKAQIRRFVL